MRKTKMVTRKLTVTEVEFTFNDCNEVRKMEIAGSYTVKTALQYLRDLYESDYSEVLVTSVKSAAVFEKQLSMPQEVFRMVAEELAAGMTPQDIGNALLNYQYGAGGTINE